MNQGGCGTRAVSLPDTPAGLPRSGSLRSGDGLPFPFPLEGGFVGLTNPSTAPRFPGGTPRRVLLRRRASVGPAQRIEMLLMMLTPHPFAVMPLSSWSWEGRPGSAMMRLENPRGALAPRRPGLGRLLKIRPFQVLLAVLERCGPFAFGQCLWPGGVDWGGGSMVAPSSPIVQRRPIWVPVTISMYPRGASLMALGRAEVVTRILALAMTTSSSTAGRLTARTQIGSMGGRAPA